MTGGSKKNPDFLRTAEWAIALLLTLLAACLHWLFLQYAGGLWRDEAGTINLAVMSRLSDVCSHLYSDSFPILWLLVVRVWVELGLGSDTGLRFLGLLVGLLILGALWFNARRLKISFPFFSLLLLGLSPGLIIWGDSMRAWGWGVFWILLTFGLIWRVVQSPNRRNTILAALAAIAAVQSTYYNAVLLFAICLGGVAVAGRRRLGRSALTALGIGAVAALSLFPYAGVFRRGGDYYIILQLPFGLHQFGTKLWLTLSSAGPLSGWLWVLALVAAFVVTGVCLSRPSLRAQITPEQQDLLLFSLTTLCISVPVYFLFLHHLQFTTMPWYYLGLLAVAAMALDAMLSVLCRHDRARAARLITVCIAAGLFFTPASHRVRFRMTNIDLIARQLDQAAAKDDLILLDPWYYGISFQRYYHGPTPWLCVPDVKDHERHRYDTIKEFMMRPDQDTVTHDELDQLAATLKAGHRVWLVGQLYYLQPNQIPLPLPPAPHGPTGWHVLMYYWSWTAHATYFTQRHAMRFEDVAVLEPALINADEDTPLAMAEGWRENKD